MGNLLDVECIKIKRGKVLSNIRLVNIPTGLFVVEFGGTCVWLTNWKEGEDNFNGRWSEPRPMESAPLTVGSETQELTRYQGKNGSGGMVKERGRGGVVQNFQTGGSDPAKQSFPSGLGGMSPVPRWVVSIEVSEDESVRGVRKDVRIEGPGARIRRTVSDGSGVEVKKLKRRVVGEKDFNTGVV